MHLYMRHTHIVSLIHQGLLLAEQTKCLRSSVEWADSGFLLGFRPCCRLLLWLSDLVLDSMATQVISFAVLGNGLLLSSLISIPLGSRAQACVVT